MINSSEENQKKIFVVLGVARSGTSVITKALNVLGVDLGNHLISPNRWNPTGFREDADIVNNVNLKIFEKLNFKLEALTLFEKEQLLNPHLDDLRHYATDLLKQRLAAVDSWGFKDPRTVRVLPFWQSIFHSLNLQDHYIIALRNPLSSAHSYHSSLMGYNIEKKLLLWLLHLIPAIEQTQGKARIIVNYDLLLQNPRAQLDRMRQQLKINSTENEIEIEKFVREFLDKKLRHAEFTSKDLKMHPAGEIVPLCLTVYDLLLKASQDDNENFLESWQEIKTIFSHIYPLFPYLDTLMQKNYLLEKSLHKVYKSIFWKAGSPIRKLKEFIR